MTGIWFDHETVKIKEVIETSGKIPVELQVATTVYKVGYLVKRKNT